MKKYVISILLVMVVGVCILWFGMDKNVEENKVAETKKSIVQNNYEERKQPLGTGNLGDGIHNTRISLGFIYENKGEPFSFDENKKNIETVVMYEKGAIQLADEENASKEIKATLRNALSQTEKAVSSQNFQLLREVEKSLSSLDKSYNNE